MHTQLFSRNLIRPAALSSTALISMFFATSTAVLAQQAANAGATQTTDAPAPQDNKPKDKQDKEQDNKKAQNAADVAVETVTVVARKVKENLQDVPIPITVLGNNEIQEKNITNFQQLENELPSISYSTGNNKQTNIGIRGIGNNGSNQDGLDPSVGILVDGVYQPRLGLITNEYVDLAQVEELRGPQGTLFGKNTTAGVILINTQLPSFVRSETAQADIGSYGTREFRGNITGPINDTLAFRLTAYDIGNDGFVKNIQNGDNYLQRNSAGARGQLLWTPDSDLTVRFIAGGDYQDFRTGGLVFAGYYPLSSKATNGNAPTLAAINNLPYPTTPGTYITNDTQEQNTQSSTEETSLHIDWKTPYGTLTNITAYNHWQFHPYNNGDQPFLAYTNFGTNNNINNESEEIRWTSPRNKPFEWQTGLYFYHMSLGALNYQQIGPQYVLGQGGTAAAANVPSQASVTGLTTGYFYSIDDVSGAAYGAGTYHITNQWDVNGGLRETVEHKAWSYNGYTLANPGGASLTTINNVASGLVEPDAAAYTESSLGYQVGTSFHFTKDILGYVSYAKGDKSSGINQNPLKSGPLSVGASQVIAPEHATNLELGLKTEWFDHRVTLNASVYDELVTNYQATGVYYLPGSATTTSYLTNVGSIRSEGIEFEHRIKPIENLAIYGSFAYDFASYASFPNDSCPASTTQNVCNVTGRSVPYTPKFYVNETAEYSHPLGYGVTAYGLISANWRSSQNLTATLDPYSEISGYLLGNLRTGVRFAENKIDLSFWITNFTNTYYFTALSGTTASGVLTGTPGQPRTFGLTLRATL